MKLFTSDFWSGFIEKTNPVHIGFFIYVFEKVFQEEIVITPDINEADILLETVFTENPMIHYKSWKYSFLFSGESTDRIPLKNKDLYSCVLAGLRNNKNIVNVPLFIPYLYCNHLEEKIKQTKTINKVPSKNICAIISNENGKFRNEFLEELEKYIDIDYAGEYKNNVPKIESQYNTEEFRTAISEYKIIISMENSSEDTYITEKITHGFLSNTIPLYWGSPRIKDYFNPDRFMDIESVTNIPIKIMNILDICSNNELFLNIVNNPIYKDNIPTRTINDIVTDIKNILSKKVYPLIDRIYFINSEEFELERNELLKDIFIKNILIPEENIKFICPTYKTTITNEIYDVHVKKDLMVNVRPTIPTRKSELSLTLNYKVVLEDIEKNFKDGIFLIFESDVFPINNYLELNDLLLFLNSIPKESWDLIHIGFNGGDDIDGIYKAPWCTSGTPYRNFNLNETNFIEDITNANSNVRLIRKFHTRCTDSFIWSYNGVKKFLNHMNNDTNYGSAFDYYLTNFLETNTDFKQYWTSTYYFIQGSNYGLVPSMIQDDR
jgi:hypothetical protein